MMYWWNGSMGVWGYIIMGLSFLLFWGAVITGIILLARYLGRSSRGYTGPAGPWGPGQWGPGSGPSPSPEDLLAERFARGEIDADEYRARLDVLRQHRTGGASGT